MYQVFDIRTARRRPGGPPNLTISPTGRLGLNKAAVELLTRDGTDPERVLLLWDSQAKKIAIRPIRKNDPKSVRISFGKDGKGAAISAKGFCDFIGIDYSQTRKFQMEWNDDESAIEADTNERNSAKEEPQKFAVHKRERAG